METIKIEKIETKLILNEDERIWLKGIMQNAINCPYEEERDEDRRMRHLFWKALK